MTVAGSCEHCDEPSKFLHQLSDYQLLKKLTLVNGICGTSSITKSKREKFNYAFVVGGTRQVAGQTQCTDHTLIKPFWVSYLTTLYRHKCYHYVRSTGRYWWRNDSSVCQCTRYGTIAIKQRTAGALTDIRTVYLYIHTSNASPLI
jgi:hypothetical protein